MFELTEPSQAPVSRAKSKRLSLKLTIAVATSGLVIFAATGFLGYCGDYNRKLCSAAPDFSAGPAQFIDSLFVRPWPLFLWLCALVFILQHAMLSGHKGVRPAKEKAWRRRMYAVTAVSIVAVGIIYLYHREIGDWLGSLKPQDLFFRIASSNWLYILFNFGVILFLAVGAIRRWIRFHHERTEDHASPTGTHEAAVQFPDTLDTLDADAPQPMAMHELVIGDVLVRSTLVLALSFVMRYEFIHALIGSWAPDFSRCSVGLGSSGACNPQLWFVDLILALLGLVGGVALAAMFAQAIVRERLQKQADVAGAADAGQSSPSSSRVTLLLARKPQNPPLNQIGGEVALQLIKTLARPFQRVSGEAQDEDNPYDPLTIISVVVWPLLVLAGVGGVATMALMAQRSLHHTVWYLFPVSSSATSPFDDFHLHAYLFELSAVVAGCLAFVAIILAARIMTRKPEALAKGLEFTRENGFMTLVLFCVYAFALWLVEVLLVKIFFPDTPDSLLPYRLKAFGFGFFTIGSFFLLLWYVLAVLIRRGKARGQRIPKSLAPGR